MNYKSIIFFTILLAFSASNAEEILYVDEINGTVELLRAKLGQSSVSDVEVVNPETLTKDPARNSYLIQASNRYDRHTGEPLSLDKLSLEKYQLDFLFDPETTEPSVNIADFGVFYFDRVYQILYEEKCVAKLIDYGISFYDQYEGDSIAYKTSYTLSRNRYKFYPSRNLHISDICSQLR